MDGELEMTGEKSRDGGLEGIDRAVAPLRSRVPTTRHGRATPVARFVAAALRHPATRRAAVLGIAVSVGYQLGRTLQILRSKALKPQEDRRRVESRTGPAAYARIEYSAVSMTRVHGSRPGRGQLHIRRGRGTVQRH